jgi:hypothetical protein
MISNDGIFWQQPLPRWLSGKRRGSAQSRFSAAPYVQASRQGITHQRPAGGLPRAQDAANRGLVIKRRRIPVLPLGGLDGAPDIGVAHHRQTLQLLGHQQEERIAVAEAQRARAIHDYGQLFIPEGERGHG